MTTAAFFSLFKVLIPIRVRAPPHLPPPPVHLLASLQLPPLPPTLPAVPYLTVFTKMNKLIQEKTDTRVIQWVLT